MNNYKYYDYLYRNNINMNNQNLFNPKEGFEKGNMFSNLYSEYKNYSSRNLNPKTEQEKLLYELDAYSFAAHDLNLYLDMHPEDQSMVTLFNDYRRKIEEVTRNYEEKYGPLMLNSQEMDNKTFSWVNSQWPWEGNNV